MIYICNDVTKLNHYAGVLSADGAVLTELFIFPNDADSLKLLSSELSDNTPKTLSSVLNQRHTTMTTLSVTLLITITICIYSILSGLPLI